MQNIQMAERRAKDQYYDQNKVDKARDQAQVKKAKQESMKTSRAQRKRVQKVAKKK